MNKNQPSHEVPLAIVIDESYMEQFTNDQLAYKAWIGADMAQEILFDDAACVDSLHDAKFEVVHACMALRVLVRRLTGLDADILRRTVLQRRLEGLVLCPDVEQFPAAETLQ